MKNWMRTILSYHWSSDLHVAHCTSVFFNGASYDNRIGCIQFLRAKKYFFWFLLCAVPLSCHRFLRTIHNNVSTYIPFQQVIYVILDNDMTNRCDWCNTIQREQPIFFTYGYDAMSNIINHLRSWLGLNVCLFVFLTLWTTNI